MNVRITIQSREKGGLENKNNCEPIKMTMKEIVKFWNISVKAESYFMQIISMDFCFQNPRLPSSLVWVKVIQTADWMWNGLYPQSATNDRVMSANTT